MLTSNMQLTPDFSSHNIHQTYKLNPNFKAHLTKPGPEKKKKKKKP